MSVSGTIFNIQRYSIHDGEGIRTVVFFKGCPLRCCWCCNPESQTVRTELMHYTQYCRACGSCVKVCPLGALSLEEGKLAINRKVCDGCFLCAEACPNGALKGAGKTMSAQQVIEIVIRDSIMYESSGGGLTLSGGEPALQPEFAREILQLAAQNGIDCTLETCGATDFRPLESLVRLCSHVLFDIKIVDSAVHKMYVGTDNARVLENAKKLANDPKVRFRIPVIPGVTGTRENFTNLAKLLNEMGRKEITLLPYHELGVAKYHYLGREYTVECGAGATDAAMQMGREILAESGISTMWGEA